jgi:hypothetical protein
LDEIGVNKTTKNSHGNRTRKLYHGNGGSADGNGGSADGNHPTDLVNSLAYHTETSGEW